MSAPEIEPLASPATSTPWVPLWPLAGSGGGAAAYGTTLPASPVDGQEAILVDSLTNPSYQWRFRYNALSASAYKWEFVGGTPRLGFEATSVGPAAGAPTYLGPLFTVPRAGEYRVTLQCDWGGDPGGASGGNIGLIQPSVNGAALGSSANSALALFGASTANIEQMIPIPASGSVGIMVYCTVAAVANTNRRVNIVPVRVA